LTKTDAKGKDLKKKLVEVLRAAVDEYKGIYVMNFENMRAAKFREIRMDWKESKYVALTQVSVPTSLSDNCCCMC
jgi:ribosomal protein L10